MLRSTASASSIDDKAKQVARVINMFLDDIGSTDAKVEIFRLIMTHLKIVTGSNTQQDLDRLRALLPP
jgi:hypothetical protein